MPAILYQPQTAYRVRWNMNTDTPMPQEEPAGQNPPEGAMINYYLADNAKGEMTLEIMDATGKPCVNSAVGINHTKSRLIMFRHTGFARNRNYPVRLVHTGSYGICIIPRWISRLRIL